MKGLEDFSIPDAGPPPSTQEIVEQVLAHMRKCLEAPIFPSIPGTLIMGYPVEVGPGESLEAALLRHIQEQKIVIVRNIGEGPATSS